MSQLIIANWKANKTSDQAEAWVKEIANSAADLAHHQVVVAPSWPLVPGVAAELQRSGAPLALAVQDLSSFPLGAYTGAVAAEQLSTWPIKFALVGHSERRRYFHETNQEVANKVEQAIEHGITPVVCVDVEYVAAQAAAIKPELLKQCVVAYEPLSAIGTGDHQPASEVAPVVAKIKAAFGDVKVLYGGSVSKANAAEYQSVTDGLLVGGQSLKANDFSELIASLS